jgi:hypothetical protein
MTELICFVCPDGRIRQVSCEKETASIPNSGGCKPRALKQWTRFFWRLGAWETMPRFKRVKLDRNNKPVKVEEYDFFSEMP